jgi:sensor histidine kinase YesM
VTESVLSAHSFQQFAGKVLYLALALLLAAVALQAEDSSERLVYDWLFCVDDHPDFKWIDYIDKDWQRVAYWAIPRHNKGVKWIRTPVTFKEDAGPLQLNIRDLMMAGEVYWDGVLLGQNGRVGTRPEEERPGKVLYSTLIDGALTRRGTHMLAIRFSDFTALSIRDYSVVVLISGGEAAVPHLYAYLFRMLLNFGIFFATFMLGWALFLGGGRFKPYIHFSLIAMPSWIIYGTTFLIYYLNMPAQYAFHKQVVGLILVQGTHFFIGFFFLIYFELPRRAWFLGALLGLQTAGVILEWNDIMIRGLWPASVLSILVHLLTLSFILYGISRRRSGAWLFLSAYLVFISTVPFDLMNKRLEPYLYDFTSQIFIFILFFTITAQLRAQNRLQHELETRAARLESEILKKAIQPHFVMNTLASLHSWFKRNPDKASRMIQTIAREYRSLNDVVSKKLIPLDTELELCRNNLELMGYRLDAHYQLVVESFCPGRMVPPLIFHTLVENGLTHAMKPREDGLFTFTCREETGRQVYRLTNNGPLLAGAEEKKVEEGTGLRYVRSRLEEAFPGKWRLAYGLRDGLWWVEITVKGRGGERDRSDPTPA